MPPEFIPSQKIIITGSLLAIFIGWLFWVPTTDTFKLKNLALDKKLRSAEQFVAQNKQADVDSDNDGLKDWEEALWHTDKNNADTDNDGTPDGEEVRLGRNPLVAGPNDALSDTMSIFAGSATGTPEAVSLTALVSKKLLTAYLQSDKKDPASLRALAQNVGDQFIPAPFKDEFSINDIIVNGDNSATALKKYLNSVGAVISTNLRRTKDVSKILTAVQNDQNYALLADLSQNVDAYKQIAISLKSIVAPSLFGSIHLEIINTANNAGKAVLEIQKLESDPLLSSHGWQEFATSDDRSNNIIRDVTGIIKSKNIILTKSDAGYIFIRPETIFQ